LLYDIAIRLGPPAESPAVFFLPAPQWTLASFNAQCLADPPTTDGGGTFGAVVIDEATITNGGQFGLLAVNGWSYARYSVSIVSCPVLTASQDQDLTTVMQWHGYAEGKAYRNGFSFLPIATYFTYLSTKWSNGSSTTTAAPQLVLNYFLPFTSGITLGDTGPTMSVPRAFDNASGDLLGKLKRSYCSAASSAKIAQFCAAIASLSP
jgi:hypothetical protein